MTYHINLDLKNGEHYSMSCYNAKERNLELQSILSEYDNDDIMYLDYDKEYVSGDRCLGKVIIDNTKPLSQIFEENGVRPLNSDTKNEEQEKEEQENDFEEEYFIGREYYPNIGFFGRGKLENLLWKILELIKWYPEKNDYEKTLDEILKMDKELNCINRKPFSDKDKRIFNTQIVLARLKGLVTFEMWKHSRSTQRGC